MTTAYEQLQEQVKRVADVRRLHAEQKARLDALRAAFDETHRQLIGDVDEIGDEIERAEHALKTLTVSHFQVTGEAKPVRGVEVKVFTSLDYNDTDAFDWAAAKGLAIKPASLDVKAFEKVMNALPEKPAFVKVVQTPRAQIATDLDKVLGSRSAVAAS